MIQWRKPRFRRAIRGKAALPRTARGHAPGSPSLQRSAGKNRERFPDFSSVSLLESIRDTGSVPGFCAASAIATGG
jgi:hypothetical protein